MTNPRLKAILTTMMDEERNYKLCLIEDIIKMDKLLSKYDNKGTQEKEQPADMFDRLYDMTINDLEITEALMEMRLNKILRNQQDQFIHMLKGGHQ
jgi:hypothetical protein